MAPLSSEYLTTKELAELLRIKERKVYELVAAGEVPCSRATGKLLFPRDAIEAWVSSKGTGLVASASVSRPNVFLGSHDPLLEWALRESGAGIASYFDGSQDGLERFANGEGVATGLHLFDPLTGSWNEAVIRERFGDAPVVAVEFAKRERGLILSGQLAAEVHGLADLVGKRLVPRQTGAGSQTLLAYLLEQQGLSEEAFTFTPPARSEADAALSVLEGKADATLGLRALAEQYRLGFVPLLEERFDLLVDRRAWFEPPLQRFIHFCQSAGFADKAREQPGYDVSGFGRVHFNGA